MTTHEISTSSSQLEIYFWDLLIQFMTRLMKIRNWMNSVVKMKTNNNQTITTIYIGMGLLFLGLYIGFLLGYLGI
jgi:hypothetical protein